MAGNGTQSRAIDDEIRHNDRDGDTYEFRVQRLIAGANYATGPIAALKKAAEALFEAGTVLEGMGMSLTKISSDTARAVSDTVVLKRHLKAITEREQAWRRELDDIKAQMVTKPTRRRKKAQGAARARKARRRK